VPFSVYFLALAVFGMGTSEFMLAGLVPGIAAALDVSLAQAGYLTSAFAAGMVAGAPLMAALARSWRRRTALLCFLAVFVATHVAGGLTTSFAVLLGTRLLAAVANAGFLAVALTAATGLVPPDRTGRALAVLLGGTTLACVAGIPGGALLDAAFGWRAAFWAVALVCLPALAGVRRIADTPAGAAPVELRAELAELRPLAGVLVLGRWSTRPRSASSRIWRRWRPASHRCRWCSSRSALGASPASRRRDASRTGGPAGSWRSAGCRCAPAGWPWRSPRTCPRR
jgi:DHA1 family chloramphenicol resistance protein-like MFS transporter